MKGVVLPGNRTVEFRTFEDPTPEHGQVVLKMRASGICGSDIRAIYRGHIGDGAEAYQMVVAGHEPAGEVVEVGRGVKTLKKGDRVAVYHINGCGMCNDCRRGYMISCTDSNHRQGYGWQRNGGHSEYILAEEVNCVKLPEPLSYVDGAMIACGVGTAYESMRRVAVSGQDEVLITGLGPVGLAVAQLARSMGASRIIGVDVSQGRRDIARKLGIVDQTFAAGPDAAKEVLEATRGGVTLSADCSGVQGGRLTAIEATRPWGRVALIGAGGDLVTEFDHNILFKNLTIYASWVTSLGHMEDLIAHLVRHEIRPDAVATEVHPLAEAGKAYEIAESGQSGKVCLVQ
jgi:threonine dehydrogenase-like Zn-dependent dehydrogenase